MPDAPDDKRDRHGLTRAELVRMVHRRHGGLSREEAAEAVNAVLSTMKSSLLDGRPVKIQNFGVLDVIERRERRGVSPSDGKTILIPQHRGLQFRPADRLRQELTPSGEGSD